MNTQNNERDRLIDLLSATSQGGDSHKIRTHLSNRFRDQEVVSAVIDYASTFAEVKSESGSSYPAITGPIFREGKELPIEGKVPEINGPCFRAEKGIFKKNISS